MAKTAAPSSVSRKKERRLQGMHTRFSSPQPTGASRAASRPRPLRAARRGGHGVHACPSPVRRRRRCCSGDRPLPRAKEKNAETKAALSPWRASFTLSLSTAAFRIRIADRAGRPAALSLRQRPRGCASAPSTLRRLDCIALQFLVARGLGRSQHERRLRVSAG